MAAPAQLAPAGDAIQAITTGALRRQAVAIDRDAAYPREIMRALGAAGAFAPLADGPDGLVAQADLAATVAAVEDVARECVSTAFCCWCQGALTWYLRCTANETLRAGLLAKVAGGKVLGGTALSNPMKAAAGLEKLLLRGAAVPGGWQVSGAIPWVSNIEAGHPFGIIFATGAGSPPAMAVVDDTLDGLSLKVNDDYETMSGTATVVARLRRVQVADDRLLALDAAQFIKRIRCGFVLIQAGIGLGILRAAADVIRATKRAPGAGTGAGLLAAGADELLEQAAALRARAFALAAAANHDEPGLWPEILRLRLELAAAAIRAATAAQLTAGAAGLRRGRRAVRLVREAAFYGVLTPSVRHLQHLLNRL